MQLLGDLLKQVSRSFYLTLRVLPSAIRPQIGLAYLLARTTDTIADTELIPLSRRLEALERLSERIQGTSQAPINFGDLAKQQDDSAERVILERCEESLALLNSFPVGDRDRIREVLRVITSGQELDLKRFAGANAENVMALNSSEELDDYTYRVAGCVGEFWTRMCRTHLFPQAALDESALIEKGIRFGKGLQLVNILRDMPRDLRQGRCYLPAPELRVAGLSPSDLLDPANEARLRPCYNRWLNLAEAHLAAGWAYTNTLPSNQLRVRLACAWPVLIGVRTTQKLHDANVLDFRIRIKVTRAEVRGILLKSVVLIPFPKKWNAQFSVTVK